MRQGTGQEVQHYVFIWKLHSSEVYSVLRRSRFSFIILEDFNKKKTFHLLIFWVREWMNFNEYTTQKTTTNVLTPHFDWLYLLMFWKYVANKSKMYLKVEVRRISPEISNSLGEMLMFYSLGNYLLFQNLESLFKYSNDALQYFFDNILMVSVRYNLKSNHSLLKMW